jgi:uncharacterized protein (TIGR03437 family)
MTARLFTASLIFASISTTAVHAQTILAGGTVNSADYTRAFAPGAIISIFGTKLATSTVIAPSLPLPTTLGGTTVQVVSTGEKLPLFFVSAGQINAQIPYDVPLGTVQITVTSGGVTTAPDTISVASAAPKLFTLNVSGTGGAVATTPSYNVLTTALPAKPADNIVLWMNGLGQTTGSPVAGQPAPGLNGTQAATLIATATVAINGVNAPVTFAGLSPGTAGLYQINVQAPFVTLSGPVSVIVTIGGVSSQANVTVPFQQLGFYFTVLGGKAVAGQTLSAVQGPGSSLAFEQSDALTWGTTGFNAWTNQTGLGSGYAGVPGLAMTLYNGTSIVYDNNGIENGTTAGFYSNAGGGADSSRPGLTDLYSMSNYFPLLFAGYFKLSTATTVTKMVGYFDALGSITLPFDPANPYVKYRMNIFSYAAGFPKQNTSPFVGDIFSSDTVPGTFAYSDSGARIVSSTATNQPKVIYRLSYTLATPITLPAGEYWFSNDASVRAAAATSSTANSVTEREFTDYITSHKVEPRSYRFSFFGQNMLYTDSVSLPGAVQVRPNSPVEQH